MTMPNSPAESLPASLSPDQFHDDVNSLKSPLNPNNDPPSHMISIDDDNTHSDDHNTSTNPTPPGNEVIPSRWGRAMSWLRRRQNRAAKYPTPFDRYFQQLELWKLCAMFWATFGSVATFVDLGLISNEFMRVMLVLLTFATLSFMIAQTLQDMVPEFALAAMITGIALVIALFHAVVSKLLHLPRKLFRLAVSLFLVAYSFLLVVTLYKVFKEDVREKEDIVDENTSIRR